MKSGGGVEPGELAKVRDEANVAQRELAILKLEIKQAFEKVKLEGPEKELAAIPVLVADRNKALARATELANESKTLSEKAEAAAKAELTAKQELNAAVVSAENMRAKLTEAVKNETAANTILAAVGKSFKDAGLDATKPADVLRDLLAKKADAEKLARETEIKAEKAVKEYSAKLDAANKQLVEAGKSAEEARKSAEEAKLAASEVAKAKAAADGTLKSLGEKLSKAKFVPANADSAAILKGLDDAIKAGTSDSTSSLREELVKLRDGASKSKADLEALTVRQQNTEKLAKVAEQQAKTAAEELKIVSTQYQGCRSGREEGERTIQFSTGGVESQNRRRPRQSERG